MATLKDLKSLFIVTETINADGHYHLYDKEKSGKHSRHLYLGYVNVKNGVVTHYPTGETAKTVDELNGIISNWHGTCKYHPDTYNPDYRKSYVAEMRIHDHLCELGFEHHRYYKYSVIDTVKNLTTIIVDFNVDDRLDDDSFRLVCHINVDEQSWIDLSGDTCEAVINNLNSMIKVFMIMSLHKSFNLLDKIGGVDLSNINDITKNRLKGFDVEKTSVKDSITAYLEKALEELKNS